MVLPLAALLPVGGAVLGGVEGYKRSGGNIGTAALGAGLGAVGGGGLRLAGTKLAGMLAGASPLTQLAGAKAAKGVALSQADKLALLAPGALGTGAAALGLPLAAGAAGGIAQGVAGGAGRAAQAGGGIIGYTGTGEPVYGGQAVPGGMGSYGPTPPTGDPLSVLGPEGMGRRLEQLKSAETQRDAMRLLLPEVYKASEARSKSEFERQMAAAGIRQNIATRAAMLQAAQQAGLGMGQTAAAQAGGALTSQYQYQ